MRGKAAAPSRARTCFTKASLQDGTREAGENRSADLSVSVCVCSMPHPMMERKTIRNVYIHVCSVSPTDHLSRKLTFPRAHSHPGFHWANFGETYPMSSTANAFLEVQGLEGFRVISPLVPESGACFRRFGTDVRCRDCRVDDTSTDPNGAFRFRVLCPLGYYRKRLREERSGEQATETGGAQQAQAVTASTTTPRTTTTTW